MTLQQTYNAVNYRLS